MIENALQQGSFQQQVKGAGINFGGKTEMVAKKLTLDCKVTKALLRKVWPCCFQKHEHLSGKRLFFNLHSSLHLTISESVPKARIR